MAERSSSRSYEEVSYFNITWAILIRFSMFSRTLLSHKIIREPYDYISRVKGKEIRVKLIEVGSYDSQLVLWYQ